MNWWRNPNWYAESINAGWLLNVRNVKSMYLVIVQEFALDALASI
jgi:hypothetical protein